MIGARARQAFFLARRYTPNVIFLGAQAVVNFVGLFGLAKYTNPISDAITKLVIANDEAHMAAAELAIVQGSKQTGNEKNIKENSLHQAKETKIETDKISAVQKKVHHTTTKKLNAALAAETKEAKTAADSAKNQANRTTQAIKAFNAAEKEVNQAYVELQKAINALDAEEVKHDAQTNHIQDVHKALLDIIVAEENLAAKLEVREMQHISALSQSDSKNTANLDASRRQQTSDLHQRDEKLQAKIEMGAIQHQSDLAQDYDKKLAKRNHQLEDLLAGQSIEILDKLSRMTTIEVKKQQAEIVALDEDDFEAVEKCQARMGHLQNFLATTVGVMDDKLKEQIMEKKAEAASDVDNDLDLFDPAAEEKPLDLEERYKALKKDGSSNDDDPMIVVAADDTDEALMDLFDSVAEEKPLNSKEAELEARLAKLNSPFRPAKDVSAGQPPQVQVAVRAG